MIWAIRGAITIEENSIEAVKNGTLELMTELIRTNDLREEDVISIFFTSTKDINVVYPSVFVREDLGWSSTPILNFEEKEIIGSLSLCIRVLLHVSTNKDKLQMKHVYLRRAKALRPDIP